MARVTTGDYASSVRTVELEALRARLSEYVRLAASGETLLLREGNRIVAELIPPRGESPRSVDDAFIAEAMRQAWLSPRVHPRGSIPPSLPVTPAEGSRGGIAADREDR
jgi:antitoxin (DNA-binding transcriptional repressor) of toxin-antitoxin stability system